MVMNSSANLKKKSLIVRDAPHRILATSDETNRNQEFSTTDYGTPLNRSEDCPFEYTSSDVGTKVVYEQ